MGGTPFKKPWKISINFNLSFTSLQLFTKIKNRWRGKKF
jgi:hypothetical protein